MAAAPDPPEARVKRPPNAWILFRTYYGGTQPIYPDGTRVPQNQISTVASKIWNKFTEAQRRPWEEQADQAKVAHMAAHPNWRYRPRSKAVKEQQKMEERMRRAQEREEARRAKTGGARGGRKVSGTPMDDATAGGVKRSPTRRLSPAMTIAASPYPCISPLPGISLENFGPSPPVSAASSPMVAPLSLAPLPLLSTLAASEQSPAATLVGSPDQPKYPVLMLDSQRGVTTPVTSTATPLTATVTPALVPTLTVTDASAINTASATNVADVTGANANGANTAAGDALDMDFDFFSSQFNAGANGAFNAGFGMGNNGDMNMNMGMLGGMDNGMAGMNGMNQLGLMENSNLSFPMDPSLLGDLTGWLQSQLLDSPTGTAVGDLSGSSDGSANANSITSNTNLSNSNSSNGTNTLTTPDASFELPFLINMDGTLSVDTKFNASTEDNLVGNLSANGNANGNHAGPTGPFDFGHAGDLSLNFGLGLGLGLGFGDPNGALNVEFGVPVAQPGGAGMGIAMNMGHGNGHGQGQGGHFADPYAGVTNLGGMNFGLLAGADEQDWANVNFEAFAEGLVDLSQGQGNQHGDEGHAEGANDGDQQQTKEEEAIKKEAASPAVVPIAMPASTTTRITSTPISVHSSTPTPAGSRVPSFTNHTSTPNTNSLAPGTFSRVPSSSSLVFAPSPSPGTDTSSYTPDTSSYNGGPSPDSYASPSSYALQPVENLNLAPATPSASSTSSSGASTPAAYGSGSFGAGMQFINSTGAQFVVGNSGNVQPQQVNAGGYVPPKGAANGNRRVAASFKMPPAIVRTASWMQPGGGA